MSFSFCGFGVNEGASLKSKDVLELSKLYEAEFNQPDLHDRILIFDVVTSWPRRPSDADVEESDNGEAGGQSKDKNRGETAVIENVDTDIPQIENKLSNGSKDNNIKTANNKDENALNVNKTNTEVREASNTGIKNIHETIMNKDVEINQQAGNENEMKDEYEPETTIDNNDNEQAILSESSEGMTYPTSKETEIIREHRFYVHSSWLAVQSSYFRSLFFGGMKESNATEVHITISDSEEQAHLTLLKAMYKIDTLNTSSVDELLDVLRLAHKYDVKFVFKKCKYCLQHDVFSLETCEKIMRFIKVGNIITDVEDLASTLQSFLAQEFSPLDKTWQTASFEELCEPSIRYLLSSNELVAESENTVFHALMYWIQQQGIKNVLNSQEGSSLLSVVRYELLPVDYLYNIVQHNSVAKKLANFSEYYLRGISYHALSDSMKQRLSRARRPDKRKAGTELFIPYTWVLPRDELDKLVETDNTLPSDEFWYCGYKMVLIINDVVKIKKLPDQKESFKATLSLAMLNLIAQSEVTLQWQPVSQSFVTTRDKEQHTFTTSTRVSSIQINYQMEIKPKVPSRRPVFSRNQYMSPSPPMPPPPSHPRIQKPSPLDSPPIPSFPGLPTTSSPHAPYLSIDVTMNLI